MFKEDVQREYDAVKNYSDVRLFTAGLVQTSSPVYDLQIVRQNWTRPSRGKFDSSRSFRVVLNDHYHSKCHKVK